MKTIAATLTVAFTLTLHAVTPANVRFVDGGAVAGETAGTVTITLERSGNTAITSTVQWSHDDRPAARENLELASGSITFAPGETLKSFSLGVIDDNLYTVGSTSHNIRLTSTDGTLINDNSVGFGLVVITDDDPRPTASIDDVRISEASGDAAIVVRLTGGIGYDITMYALLDEITAKAGSDYAQAPAAGLHTVACDIPYGALSCTMHVPLLNDTVVEPDETFSARLLWESIGFTIPNLSERKAIITIANDDYLFAPATFDIPAGATATLNLDLGQPFATPTTITFASSAPSVATAAPVTIPAGSASTTVIVTAHASGTAVITPQLPADRLGVAPSATVTVKETPTLIATPSSLDLSTGSTGSVTLSFQPPRATQETITLVANDPTVVDVPSAAVIPAGGSAVVTMRGLRAGPTFVFAISTSNQAVIAVRVTDAAPSVTSIAPQLGPIEGGTRVTITGQNLNAQCTVTFGNAAATNPTFANGALTVTAPAHPPGAVDVTVSCGSAQTLVARGFTYVQPRRRAVGR